MTTAIGKTLTTNSTNGNKEKLISSQIIYYLEIAYLDILSKRVCVCCHTLNIYRTSLFECYINRILKLNDEFSI